MTPRARERETHRIELEEYDDYASYQDGDAVVICDRTQTTAWVRSDTVVDIEP